MKVNRKNNLQRYSSLQINTSTDKKYMLIKNIEVVYLFAIFNK